MGLALSLELPFSYEGFPEGAALVLKQLRRFWLRQDDDGASSGLEKQEIAFRLTGTSGKGKPVGLPLPVNGKSLTPIA